MADRAGGRIGASELGRALLDPLALLVLGGTGAAFAATHAVPLVAVGGLSWAALVALKLVGLAGKPGEVEAPKRVPGPDAFLDPAVKAQIQGLHRARAELARVLAETPDTVRGVLDPALVGVPELEEHAVSLARRAESLNDYLRTQDRDAIAKDAVALEKAAGRASDAAAKDDYGRAVAARGEQLRALDDIAAARDRALANLSRIVSTLEALPAKFVRMRALDAAAQDALGSDVSRDLGRLNEEIRLFEQTLASLARPEQGSGPTRSNP